MTPSTTGAGVLEGKVAIVTGASRGIGVGIAQRFAAEGAAVALVARTVEAREGLPGTLRETVARIEAGGGRCIAVQADLSDPAARARIVDQAQAELGPVDILVNNAARAFYEPAQTISEKRFRLSLEINLVGPFDLMQRVIPGMRERGRGWVLNMTTSVAELPPGPPFARSGPAKAGTLYGGTKAMLNRLTVGVASEVEGQAIAVNALSPQAAILTPSLRPALEQGLINEKLFEPLETMVEASVALCTADPKDLHARVAFSLDLLLELERPVQDLEGKELLRGWQPGDLPARLRAQREAVGSGKGGGYGLD